MYVNKDLNNTTKNALCLNYLHTYHIFLFDLIRIITTYVKC